jgi:hypothetical protein
VAFFGLATCYPESNDRVRPEADRHRRDRNHRLKQKYKMTAVWMSKKDDQALVTYPEHVVRQHALRRLADVFQVAQAALSPAHRFGEELQAAPATDFRLNQFDVLDDDVKQVADKQLLQHMARGSLVIRTVDDYCNHMVRCSQMNPARVTEILKLPVADRHSPDASAQR